MRRNTAYLGRVTLCTRYWWICCSLHWIWHTADSSPTFNLAKECSGSTEPRLKISETLLIVLFCFTENFADQRRSSVGLTQNAWVLVTARARQSRQSGSRLKHAHFQRHCKPRSWLQTHAAVAYCSEQPSATSHTKQGRKSNRMIRTLGFSLCNRCSSILPLSPSPNRTSA